MTRVSVLLASTSPQRRAILDQLGIPFEASTPGYVEHDPPGLSPVEAVRAHAEGKARSVAAAARAGPCSAWTRRSSLDGPSTASPAAATTRGECSRLLAGRTHEVVSGLCLIGPALEVVGPRAHAS